MEIAIIFRKEDPKRSGENNSQTEEAQAQHQQHQAQLKDLTQKVHELQLKIKKNEESLAQFKTLQDEKEDKIRELEEGEDCFTRSSRNFTKGKE